MVVLKICGLFLWLLIVPFCVGLLPAPFMKKRFHTPGVTLAGGYILLLVLLEIIGIPVLLLADYHGFTIFSKWYTAALALCSLGGILLTLGKCGWNLPAYLKRMGQYAKRGGALWHQMEKRQRTLLFIFVLLVAFQMVMAVVSASFDGDDAYYNVQALIAQQLDTLYRVNPYTGRSAPLDVRHGLALFPVWEAYVSSMCGLHVTVFCHSIVPVALIPLTYILYWQIGKSLLKKQKELLPVFMNLLAIWQMFGNISIYTPETFLLTRTWQGKSVAANFIIPAAIWLFLAIFEGQESEDAQTDGKEAGQNRRKNENAGLWLLLAALSLAAGASSSLAVLLVVLLIAGLAFLFAIKEKRFGILVRAGFCCVPGGIYILLYLLLTHGLLAF